MSLTARDIRIQSVPEQSRAFSSELWIISNLPPPVHGVSVFNEALLRECGRRGIEVHFVRVGSADGKGIGRFSVSKAAREGLVIVELLVASVVRRGKPKRRRILYFTPSQWGPAVLRDAAISVVGRARFDRVVAHIHGCGWLDSQRRGGVFSRAMRYALDGCDKVVCLGDTYAQEMRSGTGRDCIAVDNGVEGVRNGEARTAPTDPIELLFLGNFIGSKGLWVAAEATEQLIASGTKARLRCAGDWRASGDRSEFTARFAPLIASGAIEIVGPVDSASKEQLLLESHFLLLPTRYPFEGQPLVLIEALSAGLVPITTDQGAIPDLMNFQGAEILVSPAHAACAGVVRTMRHLMEHPKTYERLSSACLDHFRGHLTFQRCADELLRAIEGGPA